MTTHICDLARSAQAIGSGELLSRSAFREQLDPGTVGLGGPTATCPATVCLANTEATHYGLGVLVLNGWIVQNPSFSGYAAVQAYLPAERLAIAVATTKGESTPDGNTAETITNADRRGARARPPRAVQRGALRTVQPPLNAGARLRGRLSGGPRSGPRSGRCGPSRAERAADSRRSAVR